MNTSALTIALQQTCAWRKAGSAPLSENIERPLSGKSTIRFVSLAAIDERLVSGSAKVCNWRYMRIFWIYCFYPE